MPCLLASRPRWNGSGISGDRRLLSSHVHGPHGPWIQRLRALERLSRVRVAHCSELIEGNYDRPLVPSLILAFQNQDAVVACFEEESQGMLESSTEPTLCTVFSADVASLLGSEAATGRRVRQIVTTRECPQWIVDPGLNLCEVTWAVAKEFVAAHHRQNDPPPDWKFGTALLSSGELIGVMMAGDP